MKVVKTKMDLPDGTKKDVDVPEKQFKTGRRGYYTAIPAFEFDGGIYTGQIQLWKKQ